MFKQPAEYTNTEGSERRGPHRIILIAPSYGPRMASCASPQLVSHRGPKLMTKLGVYPPILLIL